MKNAPTSKASESVKVQHHDTKKARILAILRTRSLNRFEAERHGDHCLHSTIAALRQDGFEFYDEYETVPTNWGADARVKRYHFLRGPGVRHG